MIFGAGMNACHCNLLLQVQQKVDNWLLINGLHKGVIGSEAPPEGHAGGGAKSKEPVTRQVTLPSDAVRF